MSPSSSDYIDSFEGTSYDPKYDVPTTPLADAESCESWTVIVGLSGSLDAGVSGTFESGVFRSKTCQPDGTVEYTRGQYWAIEHGAGATATGADASFVATSGYFNGGYEGSLNGQYSKVGGDFAAGLEGGGAVINTLDNNIQGYTVDAGVGTPASGGHVVRGYGETFNVEVYQNGEWVQKKKKENE